MPLDAIIIADSGSDSFSGTNPLKLKLDGYTAEVQVVLNYLAHDGRVVAPIQGQGQMSWGAAPKLNGIYLWSYLHRHGFETAVIDSFYDQIQQLKRLLEEAPPAVIVSTTFINNKKALKRMLQELRRMAPQAFIVAGGSFVFMSYFLLQQSRRPDYPTSQVGPDFLFFENDHDLPVDLLITGSHGEDVLCQALERNKIGRGMEDLPNTAWITPQGYRFGPQVDDSRTAELPIDWDALPDSFFASGVVPIQASSGCPYNCSFCTFVKNNRRPTVKPLPALITEMKQVSRRGARYVWFVDDNFRLGRTDLEDVCRRMIEEDLGLQWMTFLRAGALEKVDLQLLRQAGCIEVQLGIESADPQILRNMNKKNTPELYERVLANALRAGLNCSCYLIFGFPGEDGASAARTIDFMRRLDAQQCDGRLNWSIFPFVLAPLSPIYEPEARRRYRLSGYMKEWQHASMTSQEASECVLKAFCAMENTGAIYRGDNQEMLQRLTARQRRRFQAARQKLSKTTLDATLSGAAILEAFRTALAD